MTAQTGRTVSKHTDFRIHDINAVLRSIPVDTIGGLGLNYDVNDLTAFMDAIHGVLLGHPDMDVSIEGPLDTSAAQTAGTLSGSHTVLAPLAGRNTPLGFGVYIGMRHVWEAGEPVFGVSGSSANGVVLYKYDVDTKTMRFSAAIRMFSGSAAPAWGTTALT